MRSDKFNWRINHQIRSAKLRLIASDGKQIGIKSLSEALDLAKEEGLTLVEIAPNAVPPVAKIVELGKFKYEEEKKLKKQKKGAKTGEIKEVRFSPFIAEHDLNTRLKRVKEFLEDRNKVRLVVVFKGKQMDTKNFGYDLLKKIVGIFENSIVVDSEPKFFGRHLAMIISPTSKSKVVLEKLEDEKK